MNDVDVTVLKDTLPKGKWKCPHCRNVNALGYAGEGMLVKYGKYVERCGSCDYLHFWKLELSDDAIAEMLKREVGIDQ